MSKKRTWRTLHIDGGDWRWNVWRSGTIVIFSPGGEKTVTSGSHVKGLDWDTFDRGSYKGTSDGAVTPAEVKTFIQNGMQPPSQPVQVSMARGSR